MSARRQRQLTEYKGSAFSEERRRDAVAPNKGTGHLLEGGLLRTPHPKRGIAKRN